MRLFVGKAEVLCARGMLSSFKPRGGMPRNNQAATRAGIGKILPVGGMSVSCIVFFFMLNIVKWGRSVTFCLRLGLS